MSAFSCNSLVTKKWSLQILESAQGEIDWTPGEGTSFPVDEGAEEVLKEFTPLPREYTVQIKAALRHHLLSLYLA